MEWSVNPLLLTPFGIHSIPFQFFTVEINIWLAIVSLGTPSGQEPMMMSVGIAHFGVWMKTAWSFVDAQKRKNPFPCFWKRWWISPSTCHLYCSRSLANGSFCLCFRLVHCPKDCWNAGVNTFIVSCFIDFHFSLWMATLGNARGLLTEVSSQFVLKRMFHFTFVDTHSKTDT